ncbi:GumC domain-containing protein [Amycolatopsis panacis]|uniref:Polysaccharide chain length determinant N-terminal domain-containing protein n=1 Tax=Amycolatopsis panacis TaxID=2340917 RepID=A0A419I4Q5_9PSEU|nr:hypothetical protein [Amycolatopsis panacis]RJQ85479.1 hypothetical protein D5S19_13925 [Amycolatopsis panacis]
MELNEALHRTIAGHWRLLVCCLALPLLAVGILHVVATPTYVATGRLQASSTPPGTDTESDAVLNRVAGVATSPGVITDALRQAGITNRNADQLAGRDVAVARLGSSAVFNLSVTDPSPQIATGLAVALTNRVVTFLNGSGDPQASALIGQLTAQQNSLLTQRQQVAARLGVASGSADTASLSAQLSTLDQQLNDVSSALRQLQSTLITNGGSAAVISLPSGATPTPSRLATDLGLAGVGGLVAGLLAATVLELLRPRVANSRAFARELGTASLGRLVLPGSDGAAAQPTMDVGTSVRLRETLALRGVDVAVVAGPVPQAQLSAVATVLADRLSVDARPVAERRPSPDGTSGPAGPGRVVPLGPALDVLPDHRFATLRVRTLSTVDDRSDAGRRGLLVVVRDLTPYREVEEIRTLAAATGWVLLGVLGVATRGSRRGAQPRERRSGGDRNAR